MMFQKVEVMHSESEEFGTVFSGGLIVDDGEAE